MRPIVLSLLLLCVACAYDPLGISVDDRPDASEESDAGTSDAGVDDVLQAETVEPGCPSEDGWCDRTPRFRIEGQASPQPPGYLSAMAGNTTGVWAAGQHFQIMRWTGETWVQEHRSTGEVKALWIDASGFGLAVGSVPGTVRMRKMMLRRPGGVWSPVTLPNAIEEGDLTGVWGVAGDGGVKFLATTGGDVVLSGNERGDVQQFGVSGTVVAIHPFEHGSLAALLGGPDGVWRIDTAGAIEPESKVAVRSFFSSGRDIGAEGDGHVWLRGAGGVWTEELGPSKTPIIACGGAGETLMLTGGTGIARRRSLVWREETVTAPEQTSLSACLSLDDGSGWAVGYVVATGLPGIVLRHEAP